MSEIASQILAQFETLPPQEQHGLLTEMLRRSGDVSAEMLRDDQLLAIADERFQAIDAEELRDDESRAK
jgi:hypothetical protein